MRRAAYWATKPNQEASYFRGKDHKFNLSPIALGKEEDKKAPKYRSPLGDYDVMLVQNPNDPERWVNAEELKDLCYHIDGHPCILLTEGFFKAIAAWSNGIPTIALIGVEMGLTPKSEDIQGKRYWCRHWRSMPVLDSASLLASMPTAPLIKCHLRSEEIRFSARKIWCTGAFDHRTMDGGPRKRSGRYIQKNGADRFKQDILRMQSHTNTA
jgi:putative DNA primase/helicase